MTSKNLNRTRTDKILAEFKIDRAANSPYPIRYLLFDRKFNQDMFYEIPQDVEPETLKAALNQYTRERKKTIDLTSGWELSIYGDSECETSVTSSFEASGDRNYTRLTSSRRSFEWDNVGDCIMTLYSSSDCDEDTL
ncbi:hypothetical protein N7495_008318 [Penicillium taxi]|uniref:uncharacterized protein n=1 Tax=Penicillium taxi TaxID=168475 RepID=UPI0025459CBA|nr:uncharacterized protein N7495_008318 [Penicillium taxi]KAJ5888277.1 hypothetical protein N7495_008318 [Penicillium taxi]